MSKETATEKEQKQLRRNKRNTQLVVSTQVEQEEEKDNLTTTRIGRQSRANRKYVDGYAL